MSSKNASMYDTSFWKVALKPFKLCLTIIVAFAGLEALTIASHLIYLKYWNISVESSVYMRQVLAVTWQATLWNNATTSTSHLAVWFSDFLYWLFFKATWIHAMVEKFATAESTNSLDQVLRNHFIYPLRHEIKVAMLATQLLGVRVALLVSATPLFFVAYVWGFADGLVERYIRKSSAGRESSSLYHRAKYFQLSGLITLCMIYMVWPTALEPRWLLIPSAFLLGFMCRLQWKYYKKYL
jgi:integrating conjugative element membrane protein (TIGR03747 family)